jgi:hypothetical protein
MNYLRPFCGLLIILSTGISLNARGDGRPAAPETQFSVEAVRGIPEGGTNCFFAALTADHLLNVPAITISGDQAALLFLNPSLCKSTSDPVLGDIGLSGTSSIMHAFVYLDSNHRFQKSGPLKGLPFGIFQGPNQFLADQFVHCHSMQSWVDAATTRLPENLNKLNEKLGRLETLADVRNSRISIDEKFHAFIEERQSLDEAKVMIVKDLQGWFIKKRIKLSFPDDGNLDYFKFSKAYPDLTSDPHIFAKLWLLSRTKSAIWFTNQQAWSIY